MGSSLSCCCGESTDTSGEADERTTLLTDPVASSGSLQWAPSDESTMQYAGSLPKRPDEQSAITKILHETATNVIDVAALRPNCMEPNEYLEKKNFYKTRLSSFLNSPWPAPGTPRKYILRDIPDPERVLSSEPVSKNNYIMMMRLAPRVTEAVRSISVNHKEDLIVPFVIP
ncbi:Late endosomal lysosomal adaptor, MAPK and MTOR activator 1 [Nesidiocoris tenuis]|uniref:Ragulator complex protein LAMTOR1 n=1 Tax=Nesidiocoris tenuis TaxID=355587 RepID=A0ABN7AEN1_9HEMI|nr:Late endosomal lysosomal adaptor, MAPK and MTOR activator 1 [Nesidiocoris tenuis]